MKYLFINLILSIGCITTIKYVTIGGYFYSYLQDSSNYYMLDVPDNFISCDTIYPGGREPGKTILYRYQDLSIIYISESGMSEPNTPNHQNIINLNDSLSALHLQHEKLVLEVNREIGYKRFNIRGDSSIVSGINKDSLFWKEYMLNEVSCGYINVSKEKKSIFDKSLKTFRRK